MKKFKVDLPWLFTTLGVRKWLTDRALHVPAAALESCAAAAGVTPEQWRAVEATQATILYDGILIKVS